MSYLHIEKKSSPHMHFMYYSTTSISQAMVQDAYVPQALRPNMRVTLQMGAQPTEMTLQQPSLGAGRQVLFGQLAKPCSPRVTEGTYWGYTTRLASSISQVFRDGPYGVRSMIGTTYLHNIAEGAPPPLHITQSFAGVGDLTCHIAPVRVRCYVVRVSMTL